MKEQVFSAEPVRSMTTKSSGLAKKDYTMKKRPTAFSTCLLLLVKLLGLVLLLVVLLVAVVVGEAVATVAASEMVVELVVLQGGDTTIRNSCQNYPLS